MAANPDPDAAVTNPIVADHLRPRTDADVESSAGPGVYRVVGTADDTVTLLRVGDADGRREHTGTVLTVPRGDLAAFEPAENPDANRSLAAKLAGQVDGITWQGRLFVRSLAANPLPASVGLALLGAGLFGDAVVALPDDIEGILIFLGSLSLAALVWWDRT